ncbi:hypothetical protein KIH86_23090 [Paenibacillus sp. HN-1]|uniref:hypothetical protein n=1 Tax=Paenibacillus TaxID=44249 RepID=UPI001CA7D6C7|nr:MULTISPECIES: hypothetical protein [Paenibacillus]MBY9081042.1 hypothetical protein [Paenibacillus sp. CGMCC 1.18879]MBY9087079.1 hypothetical protein [Paenibacillus sinensis]
MSDVVQLDLFGGEDSLAPAMPVLNGMYYERATGLFVSYVLGRRHFEVSPGACLGDKAWKEKTKRERAI